MISELPEAVGKLLKDCIVPYHRKVDGGVVWRYKNIYNSECSYSFELNERTIDKLFKTSNELRMEEVLDLIGHSYLQIEPKVVQHCYAESIQSIIDIETDGHRAHVMNKTEFKVFIARVASELFNKSPEHKIELHHKIQMLLKILEPM
jgi:hypothetical protein